MTTVIARASESQHWYTRGGLPQYSVTAKDGSQRSTTLRDARRLDLVPSVTTILNCAAKPGLEAWKLNQMMLACMTLPRAPEESEESYIERIKTDSKEHAKKAAERGTTIHEALESFYDGVMLAEFMDYQVGVSQEIDALYGPKKWLTERSFAYQGFGGKCDLYTQDGDGVVIDFKTKEFGPNDRVEGYDEHLMQLSAYRVGLEVPKAHCANVFVSVTHPGLVKIVQWSEEDLTKGWQMFEALKTYWQLKNNYR
jgi:hypothetical protein